ncbi:hypothetical protein BS47DRAFT_1361742 [Hydnum rufescens UP504]|uniref:Uncharacterized protein n=1 Tax=Hydnum rufescens UP504 TaxID=1448309 RepID=A0A9P6AYH2_9AGAM|nr:hypothetical protein BS47DRAFT_1361742 [Hydnum rufescens UP504]
MSMAGKIGSAWRPPENKKFCIIASTPSQPPKNQAYIQLESHPKIPKVKYQHESQRSASLLNGTPTSSQVDYPDDPPLLPIQSSEPERAPSMFGYNEEPTVLLSGSHTLALNLPTSIPEACPGDLLYVWDATQVNTLLWSLPDQGADPSEDCEFIDRTLNRVFQGINVSCLAKEMRQGPCGTLGIIEGLAFFANTRSLKLEQFEIKILKLVKALKKSRKQLHVPFKVPYGKGKGVEAISEDEVELEGQPHQPQYNRGPFPTALVDEVHGVTEAFHHTLEAMAKKYNHSLHQVLQLANLGDSFHSKWLPNPFNCLQVDFNSKYAKEKEWFNGGHQWPRGMAR